MAAQLPWVQKSQVKAYSALKPWRMLTVHCCYIIDTDFNHTGHSTSVDNESSGQYDRVTDLGFIFEKNGSEQNIDKGARESVQNRLRSFHQYMSQKHSHGALRAA